MNRYSFMMSICLVLSMSVKADNHESVDSLAIIINGGHSYTDVTGAIINLTPILYERSINKTFSYRLYPSLSVQNLGTVKIRSAGIMIETPYYFNDINTSSLGSGLYITPLLEIGRNFSDNISSLTYGLVLGYGWRSNSNWSLNTGFGMRYTNRFLANDTAQSYSTTGLRIIWMYYLD
ncbi:MAG: hypothetical protein OEX12_05110 [Gammaproteobacteria bacterium]|nr:hypothetical protein [Gammaproteobacteria bacterium]